MLQGTAKNSRLLFLLDSVKSLEEAYDQMEMPLRRYLLAVLLPSLVFFFGSVAAAVALPLPLQIRLPMVLLGLLMLATAVGYPRLAVNKRRHQLEERFHLFVTHMTVLATTNIDRIEVFRNLSREDEYKALTEEASQVVQLVDTWNQSVEDACRRRAKNVPSKPLSDLFERLAYSMGAGQPLSNFLLSEQSVMRKKYTTVYEGTLDNLDVMKDLYISMVFSMTFGLDFAILLPMITGTDPTTTVSTAIVLYIIVQVGFYLFLRSIAPNDPTWFHPESIVSRAEWHMRISMAIGALLMAGLVALVFGDLSGTGPSIAGIVGVESIPTPLYASIPVTPLLLPGMVARAHEERIKARDEEFPSFIRALGTSESVKQSTTLDVLKTLREKDFGPLTPDINRLYRRLNIRLDPSRAWEYFAADANSYLIQKFSEMYLVGRQMGGDPQQLGELISENMHLVVQLREQRRQTTVTLTGILYGITAASSFAFFIALEIVDLLIELTESFSTSTFAFNSILNPGLYNLPLIEYMLLVIIMFNAMLSSLTVRAIDRGHSVNAYLHFVLLTWLGCVIGIVTRVLIRSFIAV